MTVTDFRDLKCWQEARVLAKSVYDVTANGAFSKDYGLKDQVQRAVVSIGSNIAEGFERDSTAELVKFIGYAKGSAGELLSQICTAFDLGYITKEQFLNFESRLKSVCAMLAAFRTSLKSASFRGLHYKQPTTGNVKQRSGTRNC